MSCVVRRSTGRLGHPVIDIDGHMAEHLPDPGALPRAGGAVPRPSRPCGGWLPPYGGTDRTWHEQTPAERAATRTPRGPWWSAPAGQTIDLATALFPELLYERLDEIGHRLRRGLPEPRAGLPPHRRRAVPTGRVPGPQPVPTPRPSPRWPTGWPRWPPSPCTPPRRRWPSSSTRSTELGFKAVVCAGYVQRPFAALAGQGSRGVPVRLLARPVRASTRPTTTTRCGPRPRSSACRSPSTPASSA